ncbi:MAG: hypothetical protein IPN84_16490 [Sphingomonadales bacterium]|nr:hypothetical protein [Sphingomonadales bacterium]
MVIDIADTGTGTCHLPGAVIARQGGKLGLYPVAKWVSGGSQLKDASNEGNGDEHQI